MHSRRTMIVALLGLALGVAIGAFGAHGLESTLEAHGRQDTFETAVKYHMYHMLGLLLFGLWQMHSQRKSGHVAWLLLAGVLIFSGSLYLLSVTNIKWLGAITPIGGVAFIAAWLSWAWELSKQQ